MRKQILIVLMVLAVVLLALGCKSEEQIASAVQSQSGVRDVIYNEAPENKPDTVVVRGSGETKVTPDTASITFLISTKDADAAKAKEKNDEIVTALTEALLAHDVAKTDIKTQSISLYEQYDYSKNEPVLTGYEASNRVQVTVRKVEDLGGIIADALGAGVTSYDSLNFAAASTQTAYDDALSTAVADARHKAEVIAAAAGRELKGLLSVEEQSVSQAIRYDASNAAGMNTMEAAAADGAEISTGEITMQADVEMTFELGAVLPKTETKQP